MAAPSAPPRLHLSSNAVAAGATLTVRGQGWPCAGKVVLEAYVDGVSPYGTALLAPVTVGHATWSEQGATPLLTDTLPWTVQGAEQ
ncbi:MAG TPA: hypothetical protein VK425_06790, partial [Acidimicrobiales bacterium]|nr:hypothetical protein [Acidimicrobiales bacterium]